MTRTDIPADSRLCESQPAAAQVNIQNDAQTPQKNASRPENRTVGSPMPVFSMREEPTPSAATTGARVCSFLLRNIPSQQ
mmetsp:Transcript_72224/g.165722  ORF Transcript_72224/g.165722 Transcript_72224/m.165722 type:complete len:80 (-) Transcript_72224:402-641(-)